MKQRKISYFELYKTCPLYMLRENLKARALKQLSKEFNLTMSEVEILTIKLINLRNKLLNEGDFEAFEIEHIYDGEGQIL